MKKDALRLTRSMAAALEILKLDELKVIYPGKVGHDLSDKIEITPLENWVLEV